MDGIEICPKCKRRPGRWYERAQYNSRELWWIGCKGCSVIAGGVTEGVAVHNWNREAMRIRRAEILK